MVGMTEAGGFVGLIIAVVYLGIVIYLISMLGRFVRAIERIAAKIENSPKL